MTRPKNPTIPRIIFQLSYNNNSKVIRQNRRKIRVGAFHLQLGPVKPGPGSPLLCPRLPTENPHDRPLDTIHQVLLDISAHVSSSGPHTLLS